MCSFFFTQELYSPLESTFLICKGRTSLLDLSEYTTKEKTYTSFLTYSYGMIADIDIDSEFLRCLGTFRLDLWGAYLGIKLHSYPVRLSYLSPLSNARRGNVEMPALSDPVPSNWTTIEDDIVLLWASQVSHASSHIQSSPPSRLHDGLFQIMIVRRGGLSRYNMIKWLLSLDHHGSHTNCDITEIIECVAWRLEPLTEGSYNNLDGEVVESGPIQGRVLPSGVRTFGDSVHQKQGENPLIDTLASF
jgi:sphingosine kinase